MIRSSTPSNHLALRDVHEREVAGEGGRRASGQAQGLDRTAKLRSSTPPRGARPAGAPRIIAVTSGKGGVGKTQIAANLAASFASRGKRVLLLDADLGLASLDLVLGVRPTTDILSVVTGERTLREVLVPGPLGIMLAPACPGRYEMANLDSRGRALLCDAIDGLADEHDVVIVDTAAGIGASTVAFCARADRVVLVATPDPSSIRDAYAMAKVLHRRTGHTRVDFVANVVADREEAVEIYESLNSVVLQFLALDLHYLGCVPRDQCVREAVLAGTPFVLRSPTSFAARAVLGLSRAILPDSNRRALC